MAVFAIHQTAPPETARQSRRLLTTPTALLFDRYFFPNSSGSLATLAAICRAHDIYTFPMRILMQRFLTFLTLAAASTRNVTYQERLVRCPKQTGELRHVETLFEKTQASE
jgi:hypothetical protein